MQPSENPPGRSAEAGRAGHRAETRHHRQAVCEARDARGYSVSPHGTSALDVMFQHQERKFFPARGIDYCVGF